MKKNSKIIASTVFGGLFLSFMVQITGNWVGHYTDNVLKNIDMSSPINLSVLTVIPIGIVGATIMAVIVFWFLEKDDFFITALGFSLAGFVIDISRQTGGILYYFLLGPRGNLVWISGSFALLYTVAFLTIIGTFNIMEKISKKKK